MNEDKRRSEKVRREQAQAAAGSGVEPGGREVTPREMKQMLSLRLEPELIRRLRKLASERKTTVSDLLREAAGALVDEAERQPVKLNIIQFEVTGPQIVSKMSTESSTSGPRYATGS